MLRLTYLNREPALRAGPICAAPDGDGFLVTCSGFNVQAE